MQGQDVLNEVRKKLAIAVQQGDFDEVIRLGRIAKDYEALNGQEKQLFKRKASLVAALQSGHTTGNGGSNGVKAANRTMSPQERGNSARATFVQQLAKENIVIRRVGAKKYRTQSDSDVGIAYAAELDIRPDSWFLGLADEHFDIVVLLCEAASGETLDFILAPKVVMEIWSLLSRSHGQVKFHVLRSGSTYELRVPGGRLLPIGEYLSKKAVLK